MNRNKLLILLGAGAVLIVLVAFLYVRGFYPVTFSTLINSGNIAAVTSTTTTANLQSTSPQIWFKPMETRSDFTSIFSLTNDEWPVARSETSVIVLNSGVIQDQLTADPTFITGTVAPFMNANPNLAFALNSTAASFLSCLAPGQAQRLLSRDVSTIQQLQQAGIKISYLEVESSLSKNASDAKNQCGSNYSLAERVNDIATYLKTIKNAPSINTSGIQYSLIDASLAKGSVWVSANLGVASIYDAYPQLLSALQQNGVTLSLVILDFQWDDVQDFVGAPTGNGRGPVLTIAGIKAFEQYLATKGIQSGNDLSTNSGTSDTDYETKIMQTTKALVAAGTPGTVHLVNSFSTPYPVMNLPENPTDPTSVPLAELLKNVGAYFKSNPTS